MPVTRVYATAQEAREAILALQQNGVDPQTISVVTRSPRDTERLEESGANDDLEDASVHRGRLSQFVDWLGKFESATVPSFGTILGTGDLWQDVRAAGVGNGSITGALVGAGLSVDEAAELENAVVREGRVLVVVHDQDSS